jgi:hypothetical protein
MNKRVIAALAGAAALAVPTTAAAAHNGHGSGRGHEATDEVVQDKHEGEGRGKDKVRKAKTVTFVFKGSFTAPGTVAVIAGNSRVRKGGFVGQSVTLDLSTARIVAPDANGDGKVDVTDVRDGDAVLVQARVAKGTKYAAPAEGETATAIAARKLVDKTHRHDEDDQTHRHDEDDQTHGHAEDDQTHGHAEDDDSSHERGE